MCSQWILWQWSPLPPRFMVAHFLWVVCFFLLLFPIRCSISLVFGAPVCMGILGQFLGLLYVLWVFGTTFTRWFKKISHKHEVFLFVGCGEDPDLESGLINSHWLDGWDGLKLSTYLSSLLVKLHVKFHSNPNWNGGFGDFLWELFRSSCAKPRWDALASRPDQLYSPAKPTLV
jgi:hypothetical protein